MVFRDLFAKFVYKFYLIFNFEVKKPFYCILKALCILLFIVPYFVLSVIELLIDVIIVLLIEIPFLGVGLYYISKAIALIPELFCFLMLIPDFIYDTTNHDNYLDGVEL